MRQMQPVVRSVAGSVVGTVAVACLIAAAQPSALAAGGPAPAAGIESSASTYRAVLDRYCVTCHNTSLRTAHLTLDTVDIHDLGADAPVWEKVVRKLRTREMPPPRRPRPAPETYEAFASWLEGGLDRAAAARPNPGRPALHRLNRVEYTNAIRDLLAVEVDARSLLPSDDMAFGFDNIADALAFSPGLLERYLLAARKVSRLGDRRSCPAPRGGDLPPVEVARAGRPHERGSAVRDPRRPGHSAPLSGRR